MSTDRRMTAEYQHDVADFVHREMVCCLSGLVATLARVYGENVPGVNDLAEEAFELCNSKQDWEEGALQAGWTIKTKSVLFGRDGHDAVERECYVNSNDDLNTECDPAHDDWQALCEEQSIEPYEWEIFEHWAVSSWLAEKLEAKGERVGQFDSFHVWGRTCSGQSISMDGVIQDIYDDLHKE